MSILPFARDHVLVCTVGQYDDLAGNRLHQHAMHLLCLISSSGRYDEHNGRVCLGHNKLMLYL